MSDTVMQSKHSFRSVLNNIRMLIVLIVLIILFAFLSPYFLNVRNIYAIGLTISVIGIVCIGQSLVLLTGEFDLSVGSVAGFCGIVVALLTKNHGNYLLWLLWWPGTLRRWISGGSIDNLATAWAFQRVQKMKAEGRTLKPKG